MIKNLQRRTSQPHQPSFFAINPLNPLLLLLPPPHLLHNPLQRLPPRIPINHNPYKRPPRAGREINHEAPLTQPLTHRLRVRRDLFRRRQLAAEVGAGVVVEADLEAGRGEGGDEEEVRMGLHEGGEVVGGGVAGVDVAGEAPAALVDPAEGEFETVAPAAALEGRVGEVPAYLFFFFVVVLTVNVIIIIIIMPVGVLVEEVSGFDSVGAPKDAHVAREQKGAGDGDAEHLVRVGGDAAGAFYPLEFVLVFVGEDGGASP